LEVSLHFGFYRGPTVATVLFVHDGNAIATLDLRVGK